ncbi:MAG: hypothetical protein SFV21_14250 [Rhodospirillaceae bacterium]|nr:hypothetical protein [Rhodospirillaceae bacterium]
MNHMKWFACIALGFGVWSATPANAALVLYTNKAQFLADTGATSATGPLASLQGPGSDGFFTSPVTIGSITFDSSNPLYVGGGSGTYVWSTVLPGADIAISGVENLTMVSGASVYAMGFDFVEHSTPRTVLVPVLTDTCNSMPCVDSPFTLTVSLGGTPLGVLSFNAPDDVLAFIGVWSDQPFDRLIAVDASSNVDNEYFGGVYTGSLAMATGVPEPGELALVGTGLIVLAAFRLRDNRI